MDLIINEVSVNDYLTKSNLPASDYVINPYIGCPHGCKYCYACFMKRFTGHSEEWGTFIDIKLARSTMKISKLKGKSVFLSSVTDCYNPFEKKYKLTRSILEQLAHAEDCEVGISTKSSLILRDLDVLRRIPNLKVAMSVNTLDDVFRSDMDNASSIGERLHALIAMHSNGIYTVLFMSPIFPEITDFKAIIEHTKDFIDEYWFENLNLRGEVKPRILSYIDTKYHDLIKLYRDIYLYGNKTYWSDLAEEINNFCDKNGVSYKNYFYHEKLVQEKKDREKGLITL